MSKNRFEQVDELQPDAINLTFAQHGDGQTGAVQCTPAATQGRLPKGFNSGEMPARDAMLAAIKLANELKLAIVVIDRDAIWKAEWGTLYRYEEGEDSAAT